jgi:hypothetical protein
MAGVLQHLRSSALNKRPNPASMVDGQVAINYASGSPGMFFKDSNGSLVKVGPVHVGSGAPNAVPASGGTAGNSLGEQWLDTSGGTYVFKIWDGSAWRSEAGEFVNTTGDTMTGALGIITGSASTPGLFFSGDANTGIYSPGADQVAISTNGTGRLFVDASGQIGIGASPSYLLDVASSVVQLGSSTDAFVQYKSTAGNWHVGANSSNAYVFYSGTYGTGTERMRLDSSGRLGLGTSSAESKLDVRDAFNSQIIAGLTGGQKIAVGSDTSTGAYIGTLDNYDLKVVRNSSVVGAWTATGLGIGTATFPYAASGRGLLTLNGTSNSLLGFSIADVAAGYVFADSNGVTIGSPASRNILFDVNGEKARIDSSGRLLVGTSSDTGAHTLTLQGNSAGVLEPAVLSFRRNRALVNNDIIGLLEFSDNMNYVGANIQAVADGTWNQGSTHPSRLVFFTTADGASSPTERMRIDSAGSLIYGTSTSPGNDITSGTGFYYQISTGLFYVRSNGSPVAAFNRGGNDGTLVEFKQDETTEGTISVSGTTVSYNGAHLSRWSQLPGGAARTEILRGTVLSNIDEMCDWGEEDNEQLNRMKVSDVEGDPNVAGVFQGWDDDDDTYTDDFYCAMTGDFIIRIADGVTVQRGDLLMSAGDGTAKPQGDDIVRSKTVAKVTSTHVTCTYDDGSYCVPCVLMAC